MSMLLERLLLALARAAGATQRPVVPVSRFTASPAAASCRREAAMAMMDDDVLGYVLVRVCKGPEQVEVNLDVELEPSHWPGVALTLARLRDEAKRVYG